MKLIILDRDGVINEDSDAFVKSADEWIPIAGSIDAIARLSKAGFTLVVATNQSGLGRGLFDIKALEAMHEKMQNLVTEAGGSIAEIFYCPHHPDDHCPCRKPKAGMIDAIEQKFKISAATAIIVGDSLRDLQAGLLKGCTPVLVKTGKGEKALATIAGQHQELYADLAVYNNLADFANTLIDEL